MLLNGFLSRLFLFLFFGVRGGAGVAKVVAEAFCLSFSTVNLKSSIALQKKLSCPLQLVAAWILDFHVVAGGSSDHGKGFQWQHGPWTSAWPPVVVQTTDFNTALCFITRHKHQHAFRQQHRPQTSTWPLVVTQTTDVNMASRGSTGHRHHHGLCCQHGSQT